MNPFTIVQATAADRDEVFAFVIGEMEKLYRPGTFSKEPDDLLRFDEVYVNPESCCCLLARAEDGTLIGTASLKPYDGRFRELVPSLEGELAGEVTKVYVSSDWRGKGAGKALYRTWEAFALQAGYRYGYLHTETHLPGAYPFWQSRGYSEQAWGTSELVHMTKRLIQF